MSEGAFNAFEEIVIESLSVRASGVQVRFIVAVFFGAALNVVGEILNTDGLPGDEILPSRSPPLPEFLMTSLACDDAPIAIPTGLNLTEDGAVILAPFGVGECEQGPSS